MSMLPTHRGKACFRPAAVLPAAALLAWLPGFPGHAAAQDAPRAASPVPLATVLEQASEYVTSFQADFARVVGLERYRQEVHAPAGGELADLESEVFFVGLDDRHTSLTVRNVLSGNGRSVAGAGGSVIQLLAERGNHARLRELADASAQYNIGRLRRNFNDPTFALMFLEPASQKRFRFTADGDSEVDGVPVRRVKFEERERPTIIRDGRSHRDAPSSGTLLIADDGRVMRSELHLKVPRDTTSAISVTFRYEPRLEMMVPTLMEEEYRTSTSARQRELITGRATYSNYRRFETGGRVIAPTDAGSGPRLR
jgi:hypothetical protein